MGAAPPGVRNLFRAALVIFLITVVIGILNGIDVWEVPRNTLLAHVHAGTLGWITLSVFGGAIWMLGSPDDSSAKGLAYFSIGALAIYVVAFWSVDLTKPTSIQTPIGGTLAAIAMVWMFVWAMRKMRGRKRDVTELGMGLALGFRCWARSSASSLDCSSPMSRSCLPRTPVNPMSPIPGRWLPASSSWPRWRSSSG